MLSLGNPPVSVPPRCHAWCMGGTNIAIHHTGSDKKGQTPIERVGSRGSTPPPPRPPSALVSVNRCPNSENKRLFRVERDLYQKE